MARVIPARVRQVRRNFRCLVPSGFERRQWQRPSPCDVGRAWHL